MPKKKITIDIKAEELKRKLNIRDGKDGKNGKDGAKGDKGDKGDTPSTTEVALEASKLAQVELESKIPTITQITDQIPVLGEKVRDSLELLQGEDRLDKDAIRGLDDYDEVARLAREPKKVIKKYVSSGGAQDLQSVTDIGSTTTNNITVPSISFDTSAGVNVTEGQLAWNATDETLDLGMPDGITLQVGQENQLKVRNSTGSTLLNGKPVYTTGMLGNRPTVAYARGDSHATAHIIGLLTQDISNNADGKVTTSGYVRNIDTTGTPYGETWADGDDLWVSKTTAGALTNVEPSAPHHSDYVGQVVNSHATQGSILVQIVRHTDLQSLSDVNGTTPVDGSVPSYNTTEEYFDFDKNIVKKNYIDTSTVEPTFTYSSGKLTNITYANGVEKDFTYNPDGTLDEIVITYPDQTITKTLVWSGGILQSINII